MRKNRAKSKHRPSNPRSTRLYPTGTQPDCSVGRRLHLGTIPSVPSLYLLGDPDSAPPRESSVRRTPLRLPILLTQLKRAQDGRMVSRPGVCAGGFDLFTVSQGCLDRGMEHL